ncbi:hypothetical protein AALB39_04575 [Lachnospiraceae bacterium 54-53]
MEICKDSKKVLIALYNEIANNENSYCLVIKIKMKEFAEKLNMSYKHLNLCLWYLNASEYIKCDAAYNKDEDSSNEVVLKPSAIRLMEKSSF